MDGISWKRVLLQTSITNYKKLSNDSKDSSSIGS
jgi:hypothetical protein